jgi:hypothetical protein
MDNYTCAVRVLVPGEVDVASASAKPVLHAVYFFETLPSEEEIEVVKERCQRELNEGLYPVYGIQFALEPSQVDVLKALVRNKPELWKNAPELAD